MVGLQSRPESEAAWVDIGVDDLTKYRIVEYLYHNPGGAAEVSALAAALGFRSREQTVSALLELEHSGVVWLDTNPGEPALCGLVTNPLIRSEVGRLVALSGSPAESSGLLERLARRSLARVRARGRVLR